jgi:hypothetical protein
MRKTTIFSAMIIAILLAGCVPSLYPLYTDSDLTQDQNLIGIWVNDDSTEVWEFSLASDSISYDLTQTEKGDSKYFEAYLLKLDGVLYLDTYPDEEIKNEFYKIHLVPSHIFGRIEIGSDSLGLSLFDADWLKDKIDKGEINIEHKEVENSLILTASTTDLQTLIKRYANDPDAFSDPTVLHRR